MKFDSFTKLILGDLDEKRAYKQMMKRVDALPDDYRYAFRKMQNYMYTRGAGANGDFSVFENLIDLLEESAAEKKQFLDVTGNDVAAFCDDLMRESGSDTEHMRENMNKEILEKLNRKEGGHA